MLIARLLSFFFMTQAAIGCLPSRERKEITPAEILQNFMVDQNRRLELEKEKCSRAQSQNPPENSTFCDVMWDGVMCWLRAAPSTLVNQSCPDYVIKFVSEPCVDWYKLTDVSEVRTASINRAMMEAVLIALMMEAVMPSETSGVARRQCFDNGSWSLEEGNGCTPPQNATLIHIGPIEDSVLLQIWMPVLKIVSQVGYSVSMLTLVIAFFILSTMKKLRCPRNMLHLHLFMSFIMRAFITLLIDILFVKGVGLPKDVEVDQGGLVDFKTNGNNWECKVLTSISNYCIMANYSWILMEGLYLHNLIFHALFSETSTITVYVILGWGLPVLFVVLWVVARLNLEDTMCWTTHDEQHVFLLIRLPVITSVLFSFALFVNIVRVLLVKMKTNVYLHRRTWRYRRWAKSTLVLVPLFGVHYVLFIWMSPSQQVNETLEIVCLFCDQLFASLQGFLVSLLYCLLNSEVRAEIVRKWRSRRYKNEQPKRGSANSQLVGIHSMFTASRMYNGDRGRLQSLSSHQES